MHTGDVPGVMVDSCVAFSSRVIAATASVARARADNEALHHVPETEMDVRSQMRDERCLKGHERFADDKYTQRRIWVYDFVKAHTGQCESPNLSIPLEKALTHLDFVYKKHRNRFLPFPQYPFFNTQADRDGLDTEHAEKQTTDTHSSWILHD